MLIYLPWILTAALTKQPKMKADLNCIKLNRDQSKELDFILCCCC